MHEIVLTPARMAEADRRTIAGGVPGAVLMERAGRACGAGALRLVGGAGGRRFVALCGPGNNGGDGFVAARHIAEAGGHVRVLLLADPDTVAGDARVHMERLAAVGLSGETCTGDVPPADCVIDALFGTGFTGVLEGRAAKVVDALNASGAAVLAVDVPSGVNGLTGAVTGPAVRAHVTVCMQARKTGLVLEPGARLAGEVECVDIGIDPGQPDALLGDPAAAVAALAVRDPDAHKWAAGSVLVVGGSVGMSGAPALAGTAALRPGAGLAVAALPRPVPPLTAARNEELKVRALPAQEGRLAARAPDAIGGLERFGAVAVGPGLGRGTDVAAAVRRLLAEVTAPLVLDADGLNNVTGADLARRVGPTVVTPHEGEFVRLGGDLGAGENRLGAAQVAADAWRVVVLLKGPATIVAAPGRAPVVCREGGPELATAGSGDVLTGCVAAYLARGADPFDAAVAAACVHGVAGRLAAERTPWIVAGDVLAHLGPAEEGLRS